MEAELLRNEYRDLILRVRRRRIKVCTVIQNTLKTGQKYLTVPGAQERVSERASERVSGASERAGG